MLRAPKKAALRSYIYDQRFDIVPVVVSQFVFNMRVVRRITNIPLQGCFLELEAPFQCLFCEKYRVRYEAVLCNRCLLTLITQYTIQLGSNSWRMSQPTGKVTDNVASSKLNKPLPYSSIVYLSNDGVVECMGILIAQKFVLSDGSCGKNIITFIQVSYIITIIGMHQLRNCHCLRGEKNLS